MRKVIISSIVVVLLLTLISWGSSSWYLGIKAQDYMTSFSERVKNNPDALFTFDVLKYDKSIFKAKATIRLNINPNHNISRLFEGAENSNKKVNLNSYDFTINVTHGPLFVKPRGVLKGGAIWTFGFDPRDENFEEKSIAKELISALEVFVNFENTLVYRLPLKLDFPERLTLDMFVNGSYDLKTSNHNGSIKSNELSYIDDHHSIVATGINLRFQQRDMTNNESIKFKVSGEFPNVRYGFKLFPEGATFNANYTGDFSLIKDQLNIYSQLLFDMTEKTQYPIEKGDLRFKVNELAIDSLRGLNTQLSRINNVQEQIQWVLEEQGEFPEGQDKMWELQDSGDRLFQELPLSIAKAFFSEQESDLQNVDNARLRFYLKTEYNNEDSIINGALYPMNVEESNLDILSEKSRKSLFSLLHPQAEVRINNDWLTYLSSRFPINENNFTLSYENKQLLMQ